MRSMILALLACLALAGCSVSVSTDPGGKLPEPTAGTAAQQAEAEKAALRYLDLIDRGRYEDTWAQAGPALREATSGFMWVNTLKLTRKAFGVPPGRRVEGYGFSPRIDANAPVGEYVLVQFRSDGDRVVAIEKLVMQKEAGEWKIVGYFVEKRTRPARST